MRLVFTMTPIMSVFDLLITLMLKTDLSGLKTHKATSSWCSHNTAVPFWWPQSLPLFKFTYIRNAAFFYDSLVVIGVNNFKISHLKCNKNWIILNFLLQS